MRIKTTELKPGDRVQTRALSTDLVFASIRPGGTWRTVKAVETLGDESYRMITFEDGRRSRSAVTGWWLKSG